jgi:hypothetical protein
LYLIIDHVERVVQYSDSLNPSIDFFKHADQYLEAEWKIKKAGLPNPKYTPNEEKGPNKTMGMTVECSAASQQNTIALLERE